MKEWVMPPQLATIVLFDSTIAKKNQHNEIIISQGHTRISQQLPKLLQETFKCQNQNASSFSSE